jgi:hypothetical protein
MKKNIANLIKVKTIVTFAIVATFIALALRGDIEPNSIMTITTTVIAFYFGTQKIDEQSGG